MAATAMAALKLTNAQKGTTISAAQSRRNKMSKRLWEQIQLATAQANGTQYSASKFRTIKDTETGFRKQVEVPKRVKAWWFTTENGKTAIAMRYGTHVLELAKGKFAVEIASPAELIPTLEVLKSAIEAGELDAQLEVSSGSVRSGFKR